MQKFEINVNLKRETLADFVTNVKDIVCTVLSKMVDLYFLGRENYLINNLLLFFWEKNVSTKQENVRASSNVRASPKNQNNFLFMVEFSNRTTKLWIKKNPAFLLLPLEIETHLMKENLFVFSFYLPKKESHYLKKISSNFLFLKKKTYYMKWNDGKKIK